MDIIDAKNLEPQLTLYIQGGGLRMEVYLLNPGECFPRFGGSSSGLVVNKTASIITRTYQSGSFMDTEYDIKDREFWGYLGRLIDPNNDYIRNVDPCDERT